MTKNEIAQCVRLIHIADTDEHWEKVDDEVLHGLYLPEKGIVHTTTVVVAKFLRHLILRFDGSIDNEALNEFCQVAKRKIRIVS
jgi:hypothetical protein